MAYGADTDSRTIELRKRELRGEMRARRKLISAAMVREVGNRISDVVAEDRRFRQARTVAIYAASDGEPDIRRLFDLGSSLGKTMLLPRCRDGGSLSFHAVARFADLVVGSHGLLEPSEAVPAVDIDSIEFVVVPGVAVDQMGGRLGRGGGWYDRTLRDAGSRKAVVVGAVHSFQIVDRVPMSSGDRSVDAIVSESGLIEAAH